MPFPILDNLQRCAKKRLLGPPRATCRVTTNSVNWPPDQLMLSAPPPPPSDPRPTITLRAVQSTAARPPKSYQITPPERVTSLTLQYSSIRVYWFTDMLYIAQLQSAEWHSTVTVPEKIKISGNHSTVFTFFFIKEQPNSITENMRVQVSLFRAGHTNSNGTRDLERVRAPQAVNIFTIFPENLRFTVVLMTARYLVVKNNCASLISHGLTFY
jgi:hypothetical protein